MPSLRRMIDTTRRSHQYQRLDFARLLKRGAFTHLRTHPRLGPSMRYVLNPENSGTDRSASPQITVYSREDSPVRVVSQASLPKLIHGTNVREITEDELPLAYELESNYVSEIIGEEFDSRTALLDRIDLCRTFFTGSEEQVRAYVQASSAGQLPHRVCVRYGETTVYFKAKSKAYETLLYGKYEEMRQQQRKHVGAEDVSAAYGILRFEDRFKTGRAVTAFVDRYDLPDKRAETLLRSDVIDHAISDKLEKLGLHKPIRSYDESKAILIDRFGGHGVELCGVLEFRREWGDDFWKKANWSNSRYYRVRAELKEAGLWMVALTEYPLPALTDLPRERPDSRPLLKTPLSSRAA